MYVYSFAVDVPSLTVTEANPLSASRSPAAPPRRSHTPVRLHATPLTLSTASLTRVATTSNKSITKGKYRRFVHI